MDLTVSKNMRITLGFVAFGRKIHTMEMGIVRTR